MTRKRLTGAEAHWPRRSHKHSYEALFRTREGRARELLLRDLHRLTKGYGIVGLLGFICFIGAYPLLIEWLPSSRWISAFSVVVPALLIAARRFRTFVIPSDVVFRSADPLFRAVFVRLGRRRALGYGWMHALLVDVVFWPLWMHRMDLLRAAFLSVVFLVLSTAYTIFTWARLAADHSGGLLGLIEADQRARRRLIVGLSFFLFRPALMDERTEAGDPLGVLGDEGESRFIRAVWRRRTRRIGRFFPPIRLFSGRTQRVGGSSALLWRLFFYDWLRNDGLLMAIRAYGVAAVFIVAWPHPIVRVAILLTFTGGTAVMALERAKARVETPWFIVLPRESGAEDAAAKRLALLIGLVFGVGLFPWFFFRG
ncbi:MAG: hypothetical protein IMW86_04185 [Hydrogenibacillus sp.]|nr:hypothetical protein [Hydrogenibacillus sp.]